MLLNTNNSSIKHNHLAEHTLLHVAWEVTTTDTSWPRTDKWKLETLLWLCQCVSSSHPTVTRTHNYLHDGLALVRMISQTTRTTKAIMCDVIVWTQSCAQTTSDPGISCAPRAHTTVQYSSGRQYMLATGVQTTVHALCRSILRNFKRCSLLDIAPFVASPSAGWFLTSVVSFAWNLVFLCPKNLRELLPCGMSA